VGRASKARSSKTSKLWRSGKALRHKRKKQGTLGGGKEKFIGPEGSERMFEKSLWDAQKV
jgi:hypothetical protein